MDDNGALINRPAVVSTVDSSKEECDFVIVWIRLPGMALHYYHKRILRMIGQIGGNVVRIDYNTESATRQVCENCC